MKGNQLSYFVCPHCDQKGVSFLRKMFLGPAVPATCKCCGKKVGVSYKSMIGVLPIAGAYFIAKYIETMPIVFGIYALGFIFASIIQIKFVSLEAR